MVDTPARRMFDPLGLGDDLRERSIAVLESGDTHDESVQDGHDRFTSPAPGMPGFEGITFGGAFTGDTGRYEGPSLPSIDVDSILDAAGEPAERANRILTVLLLISGITFAAVLIGQIGQLFTVNVGGGG